MCGLEFHKLHGTGNDFIVVDNYDGKFTNWSVSFVKEICAYHTGIGADGFLVIEKSETADFRMRFFNSDGYEAEMCVNGSRCICHLAYKLNLVGTEFTFQAGDGTHKAKILSDKSVRIQVLWQKDHDSRTFPVDFNLPGGIYFKKFLNTGVPHLILECKNIENIAVHDIGEKLRFHDYYKPQGTNVNFVQKIESGTHIKLSLRTYERGVDAETLSCGSGATACAISYADEKLNQDQQIEVETTGGKLNISILKNFDDIQLEGPVAYIFKGNYPKEGIS